MNKSFFLRILAMLMLACVCITCALSVSAETENMLNLTSADKNLRGDGYEWNNPDRILTLSGLDIDTADDFGLRIPDNCTVVLEGTNTIKSAKFGIGVPGSVVFKGEGKLIIESGKAAVYNFSYSNDHKMRFGDGKYSFKAETPIVSDRAEVVLTGGSLELISTTDTAADTRVFSVSGGTVEATGTISADHLISVDRADVSVSAKGAALASGNLLKLENVNVSVGTSLDSVSSADEYKGESAVVTKLIKKGARASIIFGEGTPITVDYVILAFAIVLIGAAVALPIIRKKAKVRKLYEGLEAEKAKEAEAKKKNKK